jgi:glucose/arabinose dehydrogenase
MYADAVIDTEEECVRIDVHRMDLENILGVGGASNVIASTEPCVDYTEPQRASSALRTHLGSALAWDEDTNTLFLTVGDFHLGASTIGQAAGIGLEGTIRDYSLLGDPASMVGSVVSISDPLGDPEVNIVAKGLRNSLGILATGVSGVWLSDHGPSGGDELNLITEGSNYGWPLTSAGKPYDRAAWPRNSSALLAPWLDFQNADIEGTTPPVLSWTPAIAPTEMAIYPTVEGGIEDYQGLVLMASLRAQSLFVLDLAGPTATELREVNVGERLRNLTITESGDITMLTDSRTLLILSALR